MRKFSLFAASIATALALGVTACGGDNADGGGAQGSGKGPIDIGILIPQSGDAATTGRFMTTGAKAAVAQINATGGVAGHQLKYKVYDTVGDPQSGINAYNKFSSDGLKFAITGFSAVVTAIGPISSRQDVLLVNSGAPPFDPKQMGSNTIHTLNGQSREMSCAAKYAYQQLGSRKVAAVFADIAANRAGVDAFGKDFGAMGGQMVDKESAPQGSADFRSILTRVKQKNPDTVYIYTYGTDPGNILKQMQELGINAKALGYSGAAVPQTIEVAGKAAEGSYYTAGVFDPSQKTPQMNDFLKYYTQLDKSAKPSTLGFYNATLYDGVEMLAKAMEYVASHGGDMTDPKQVKDAFYKVGTFDAVTGKATYVAGDPVARKPFQVLQVKGGKFVPIGTVTC